MHPEKIAFYVISLLVLGGGLGILFSKHLIRAVVYLLVSLLGIACFYILLNAEFLASMQVLVYIGGITVLMVFGLLLVGEGRFVNPDVPGNKGFFSLVSAGLFGGLVLFMANRTGAEIGVTGKVPADVTSTIGKLFLMDNIFAFELASVLLLVVLVGVAVIIRYVQKPGSGTAAEDK